MRISQRLDKPKKHYGGNVDLECNVTVTFTDGSAVTIPYDEFTGHFDDDGTLHESEIERRGWAGEVAALACDNWRFDGIISLMVALWRPSDAQH